ncbi:MAG: trypsin-like serine protease [Labilithrix sp.]|nr:trypsin-like serine protease [Labilithrix sp.]MCW5835792.1 trypsin-like serine protease [Labilithrix sp.]
MTDIATITKHDAIKLSLVAALAFTSAGCALEADEDTGEDEAEATAAAIVGGQTTTGYAAVGALTQRGSSFCTGTVVAKRLVVTAAHCLDGVRAADIRFVLGSNASAPQARLGVARAIAHPRYDARSITNDIGVLVLSSDAPVAPIPLNDSMSSSWVGRALTFVGFGATNGVTGRGGGVKRAVDIAVSQVGSTQFSYADRARNTCFGDSGGPAFARDASGALTLVGVTSYGDQTCSRYGVDTRVDVYKSFIASAQP